MLDELGDAAVVLELAALGFVSLGVSLALVGQGDDQTFIEEGEFAEALRKRVEVVFESGGENGFVGNEVNLGAGFYFGGSSFS